MLNFWFPIYKHDKVSSIKSILNSKIRNMHQLKGKTKEQIFELLGSNYISEFGGDMWVYVIDKTWFRRKKLLMIEFDDDGIVISVEKVNATE